jgi:hypothetical protein
MQSGPVFFFVPRLSISLSSERLQYESGFLGSADRLHAPVNDDLRIEGRDVVL